MKEKKRLSAVKLILYSRGKKNKLHHNNSELFFYLLMNLAIFRIYIYKNGIKIQMTIQIFSSKTPVELLLHSGNIWSIFYANILNTA